MRVHSLKRLTAIAVTVTAVGIASPAKSESCLNSCVTMAIPSSPDGVYTKLDGTADAVLWPPTHDLRKIRIAALNDHGADCNVTIHDVRQDEAPRVAGSGATIDDAVNCSNDGDASSVELRSDRSSNGDGRVYHIMFNMDDPDCTHTNRPDEVLIVVPHDDDAIVSSLKSYADDGSTLTASYAGSSLQCTPRDDDRLARNE